ncbi:MULTISPECIES: FprA family A-type flavoprotein [Prosthecochloris]|uniref:FprA family A-type flavoprotein n=1 Tax=Prosthecochloris vibrioformis TaxID=1098 RepID=A0A5C4S4J2_PROVB|nr:MULTISPECIES: FprA family A-type flavoprotein [Prosthecochloris]ANT63828.1 H(2)O-forming NADH oxidase [Prosthecochloris sp. CIB 2401]TNJ37651.1 FprA family A-type flavoprotein [Prosthecochloris vibrioformis]
MNDTKVLPVTDDVTWIGVLDPGLVTFDIVMATKYGTTYNSYFINAEKKTLIETTKVNFWPAYLEKIKQVTDPSEIAYIVVDHTEPDHSGNIANLLELCPEATVVGSANALKFLRDLVGREFKSLTVKDGDTLDLGNKTLRFINALNLHWPDSIYTWIEEDQVLFTCDSFGCHYCNEAMYDDLCGDFDDAFTYYFDAILRPFSKYMLDAIERIKDLDIKAICPGHGPILRKDWKKYVDLSRKYAQEAIALPNEKNILIAYVSAYENTTMIAEKIAEGIRPLCNFTVDICDIENMHFSKIEEKIAHSTAIIVGSPTINQNIVPQIYQLFAAINPIRDKGKLGAAFGSYGWSGESTKIIESNFTNLKLKLFDRNMRVKFKPHAKELEECVEFGRDFAQALIEKNKLVCDA